MTNADSAMSQEYKDALESLLFQLADDDFMYAYRGSECRPGALDCSISG